MIKTKNQLLNQERIQKLGSVVQDEGDLICYEKGITIKISTGFLKSERIAVFKNEITDVQSMINGERYEFNTSGAVGTVILFGSKARALIGAAGTTNNGTLSYTIFYRREIDDEEKSYTMNWTGSNRGIAQTNNTIAHYFKFLTEKTEVKTGLSPMDELLKAKELLADGLLTREEFGELKDKILN